MEYPFIPYVFEHKPEPEIRQRAEAFYQLMQKRRSIRGFADAAVSKETISWIIKTASTAPSGAHKQPWHFCAVQNHGLKQQIRQAAEKEEALNYHQRMSEEWLRDLAPLGTDEHKPFLEIAPWLIVVFKKSYDLVEGEKHKNYYVNESVGLAAGFLLAAIHQAGLASLTHTPSPMQFLEDILDRPKNERAFLLIPVGYPAEDVKVPDISRKPLDQIAQFYE